MFDIGETVKEKPEFTCRNEFSRELSSRSEDSGQQQKRILIIDDDIDVTMTLGTVLEQNGFKTDTYTNPALAYKNFRDSLCIYSLSSKCNSTALTNQPVIVFGAFRVLTVLKYMR